MALFYGMGLLLPVFLQMLVSLAGMGAGGIQLVIVILLMLFFAGTRYFLTFENRRLQENGRMEKPFLGGHFKEKWPTLAKPFAGILLAAVILVLRPVSDWFYYIGAFACMGTVPFMR